jgi:hypothetical protein
VSKRKAPRPAAKAPSLSELVGVFFRLDNRETETLDRAQECEFKAAKSFPKRAADLFFRPVPSADWVSFMTVADLNKHWDDLDALAADDAARAVNAKLRCRMLERLRVLEAKETAILEAAGYYKLKAKADAAQAAAERAIEQILSCPIASWPDVAAMLRFMERWEHFGSLPADTGDVLCRSYRAFTAAVNRKVKR